ncbi:helix-turn-helix transcriptional regulator [Kluyvera ascorbata]|uniref:helix-turn-helix transcriptional regulator n=1 Tax=Kluyvera ascorbata TaxID=51288 RepID=UPI000564FD0E|nr:helix-turn-helix transcriptional regulator [Kluyvera ascorbata]EJG2385580.1 helix-turn-helix domain-containing protein [Kluyvera ascorbata]MDU1197841.1 helix-turn-helix transcriptional regulator [Kluyvera ascorbata]MDU3910553.1 helix-turn-helix transcriptional regulator [Kluyvera ascorbata]MDZ4030991.1 helix-turn-helix transcriptional regulator [Kluyvera ascorbata]MEB6388398.1 helix-turn-helix transcriptional regulator [Kluyvera ascorbata]
MDVLQTRQMDSRKQLGAFLRARRESLDPQRLGLPRSGRRRTPGLRREEVAMLADVGVTWYTWLEQGREVNPSVAVMQAVAEALQCSELETRHLFVLAGLTPLESLNVPQCEGISPGTRRMLDSLLPQPASIQKPNFDIVAWNDAFCRLMGVDFSLIPEDERNCIYLYLTHPGWRSRLANPDVMGNFVSYFRAAMAEHRGEPAWENKLARFFAASAEFEALWHQRYEVRGVENQIKTFRHPEFGEFQLQQMYWYSAPRNGSRLLVYLPVDEVGEGVLARL